MPVKTPTVLVKAKEKIKKLTARLKKAEAEYKALDSMRKCTTS